MSAIAPNPQTESGIGGAHDYSQFYLPQDMGIDSPPPGVPIDSDYLTAEAQLRADISGQYQDELGYLGYTDANGNYIPGSLLTDAQINEAQYEQQRQQAIIQNTQTAQQQGTLFSGQRGVQQAQAEAPYLSSIAGIEEKLPVDLSSHFEKAAGLISSYKNQQSALLAGSAARAAAAASANPPAAPATTPPATTAPPATSPPNTFEGIPTGPNGTYSTLPAYLGPPPSTPRYFAQGGEVDGATPAVIGEQGPEAVVPRTGLTPDENQQLTQLRQAAQLRMGGGSPRLGGFPGQTDVLPQVLPGIHAFGPPPTPAGWLQPGGPIRLPHPAVAAGQLYAQGHHDAALNQWLAHHQGYVAGRSALSPHWVQLALAARNRMRSIGIPEQPAPTGFGHTVYEGPLGGGAYA